jgi:hypothetical protein
VKREPGWYKDPYFRNQERYWDGEIWSQRTRNPAAMDSSAPDTVNPPAAIPEKEGAAPPAGPAVSVADTATAMLGAPESSQPTSETPATPAKPSKGAGPKTKRESSAKSGSQKGAGASGQEDARPVPLGAIIAPSPPTGSSGEGAPGRRRGLLIAFVAALVVLFVVVGVYLTRGDSGAGGPSGSGSGSGGTASQTGVASAVQKTLHDSTVDATVDVDVSSAKKSAPQKILSGTGALDLQTQTGTMSLTVPGTTAADPPTQIVFIGPTVYVNLGPRLSSLVPGKTWITATSAQLGSPGSGLGPGISSFEQLLGNPAALVQQLNTSGVRFTSLGTSTFQGSQVQRYQVKIPSGQASTPTGVTGTPTTATAGAHTGEDLYVSSKGVVKAIVIPVVVSSNGQSFHESINIVFSHYGHPVSVVAPPAPEIATLAQYVAAADQAPPGPGSGGVLMAPSPSPTN